MEKAVSDAQQESQFKDVLNQHLLPLRDINHDSGEKKGLNVYNARIFSLAGTFTPDSSLL